MRRRRIRLWEIRRKLEAKYGEIRNFAITYSTRNLLVLRFRDPEGYWREVVYDIQRDKILG